MIQIPFKLLTPTAKPPTRATEGSAGLDLYADLPGLFLVKPGEPTAIPTGLALAIPEGYCGLIVGRSGLAKQGTSILGGLLDRDFRGDINVILQTTRRDGLLISPGDRIAQLLILPVPAVELVEAADLPPTTRGDGGFGHTGR
jgi:dUTP pyrophosphatase